MSEIEQRAAALRELLAEANDLDVFSSVLALLEELREGEVGCWQELLEEVGVALDLLKQAHPIRAERAMHPVFSNYTALIDPCSVTLVDDSKFDSRSYERPGIGFARTLRIRNTRRRSKKLTARDGARLAGIESLNGLEGLELHEQSLGPKGVASFASSPHLKNLRALSISGSKTGAEGAAAIASNPALSNLEILILSQGRLGDSGVEALSKSPHLTNLRVLVLEENQLGSSALRSIAESETFDNLTHLVLHSNKNVGAEGARHLAASTRLRALTHLHMRNVNMRTAGAKAFALRPIMRRLELLDVLGNSVTAAGKEALELSEHLNPACRLLV